MSFRLKRDIRLFNLTLVEDITQNINFQNIVREKLQDNSRIVYCEDCRHRKFVHNFFSHNENICTKTIVHRDPIKKKRVIYRDCDNENRSNICAKYGARIDWRYKVKQWIQSWF